MNDIITPITADGRTGFDRFGQLVTWTLPDSGGYRTGYVLEDVREATCAICGQPWKNSSEDFQNQHVARGLLKPLVVHRTCYQGLEDMTERALWSRLLRDVFSFSARELPNQYWKSHPTHRGTPWFELSVQGISAEGRFQDVIPGRGSSLLIVAGRRKRVWELRLYGLGDLDDTFRDVEHTKGCALAHGEDEKHYYIHAWEEKELSDYLKRFAGAALERGYCRGV